MMYHMKYHMTTAYGILIFVNFFGLVASVFGIGQGSTDGPPGWACISDILLKCYHQLCIGCTIQDPDKLIMVSCNADIFMDNNTLMHNSKDFAETPTQLMHNIQQDVELWGRLLRATGGLSEFLRSTYFLLIWQFESSGRPIIVPKEELPTNTMK
eukprot:3361977-Ditylum_brightwellii.AAC.1